MEEKEKYFEQYMEISLAEVEEVVDMEDAVDQYQEVFNMRAIIVMELHLEDIE